MAQGASHSMARETEAQETAEGESLGLIQQGKAPPRQSGPELVGLREDLQREEVCHLPKPPKGLISQVLGLPGIQSPPGCNQILVRILSPHHPPEPPTSHHDPQSGHNPQLSGHHLPRPPSLCLKSSFLEEAPHSSSHGTSSVKPSRPSPPLRSEIRWPP